MGLFYNDEIIKNLREKYPEGSRVVLEFMDDEYAPPIGIEGTVRTVDDTGTIHVNWDNGSSLGVLYGVDRCRTVDEKIKQTEEKVKHENKLKSGNEHSIDKANIFPKTNKTL